MISVIISVFGNDVARKENFASLLDCISIQTEHGFEVIVVEQYSSETHFDSLIAEFVRFYITIRGEPFNVSWCRNVGARRASNDTLLFLDIDMAFGPDYFSKIKEEFTAEYALGWERLTWLTASGKQRYLRERDHLADWRPDEIKRQSVPETGDAAQGGSGIFNRGWFFNALGGYHEEIVGWGTEDCEIMERARALTGNWNWLHYPILHLYHPNRVKAGKNNLMVLQETRKDPVGMADKLKHLDFGNAVSPAKLSSQEG